MRFCLIVGGLLVMTAGAQSAAPGAVEVKSVVRADRRTGRLVRAMAAPPRATRAALADQVDEFVRLAAGRYRVDPLLVRSVIEVESNYNLFAVSPKGAQGLMQLMPGTARRFAVKNSFNPWQNIDGGVRYLKYLLDRFNGQDAPETLALAAYNAGEGAVLRHGGVPPYQETTEYVRKVAEKWKRARAAAGETATAEAAAYPPIEQFVDSRGVLHYQTRSAP
jgi:hypothetical protein